MLVFDVSDVSLKTKHLNKYGGYIKTYPAGAIVQLLREEDVFRSAP